MALLHAIFAFNLVTSLGILGAAYAIHRRDDTTIDGRPLPRLSFAGMSGAALALGMVSGIHTQPAALAFASERSAGSDLPRIGYASVFPIATVGKIVIAQLLSSLLS